MSIQTPKFPDKFNGLDLESNLTQRIKIPSIIAGNKCTIFVEYKHNKIGNEEDKKTLDIFVPEAITPNGQRGVYGEFYYNGIPDFTSETIKGRKDYWKNPEIKNFFVKHIQPILDENILSYMLQVIKQK